MAQPFQVSPSVHASSDVSINGPSRYTLNLCTEPNSFILQIARSPLQGSASPALSDQLQVLGSDQPVAPDLRGWQATCRDECHHASRGYAQALCGWLVHSAVSVL